MELDASWRESLVIEYYDTTHIVFIYSEQSYGTVEKLGAWASMVKYNKDGIEYNELMENDEFTIVDEIVFKHVEESE
jgi:hypothetical protein